jgi:hypothetical protein
VFAGIGADRSEHLDAGDASVLSAADDRDVGLVIGIAADAGF